MAYQKHTWAVGEPITQERMNAIENALNKEANTNDVQDSNINNLTSTVQAADQKATQALAAVNDATLQQNMLSGQKAWSQIKPAIELSSDETVVLKSLNERLTDIETINTNQGTSISSLNTQVTNAYKGQGSLLGALNYLEDKIDINAGNITNLEEAKGDYDTLRLRLNAEDTKIYNLETEIGNAHQSTAFTRTTAAGNPFESLDARLEEGESRIVALQSELNDAHASTALGKTGANAYGSIDARFEAIEEELVGTNAISSRIDTLAGNVDDIANNKISTTAIANNLTTNDSGKVLDARQGKALNEAKVNYTDIVDDLTHTDADKPLSANQGKVLKTAIDAIDSDLNTTTTGIKDRLTAVETLASGAATEGAVEQLDARLDAIDGGSALTGTALHTRVTNLEDNLGNGFDSTHTVSDAVSTISSSLANKANSSDVESALAGKADTADLAAKANASDLTNLAGRVTTLENNPQSSTLVVEQVTYNNDGIPTSISNPSADIDYVLKNGDQYYYWKYINNSWKLISGGGGSGTSSAEFYATLPVSGEANIDYFIGSGTNYVHYRYLNNQWVTILPQHLINSVSLDQSAVSNEENAPTKSKPVIKEFGSNTNLLADFTAIQSIGYVQDENGTTLTWIDIDGGTDGVTITGGGGSSTSGTAAITRITNGNITTITGETCEIEFNFTATDSSGDTLATTSQGIWSINRAQVATSSVVVGDNTFDITQYLRNGENNITLTVNATIDEQIVTRTKTWVVNVINFSLVWDYDESIINEDANINFSCIPYGMDITKTLHLKIGNATQTQTVTTSGIPTTVTLVNNFTHGVYTAEMWMTATINGQVEETLPHIFHDFIVAETGNSTPIIAATLPSATVDQYNTISIPFVVYTPNSNVSTVTLAVDGVTQDTREVGRASQTWHYTPLTSGAKILTISTGNVTKTLNLTVNSININNNEIGGYDFKLKASELPSNNALKAWHFDDNNVNGSKLQFSNNFDWVNGGIQTEYDEQDQIRQYIRIKSGTTMTIPYKIFAEDPRANGMNFKIIFKIDNCRDYDATAMTNMAENIGIKLDAHKATFKSTTTEISTQYGEEEYTELEFEVYKALLPNGTDAPNKYIMAWVDGVMTTARPYGGNFVQTSGNAQNIVIGSADCDICVYLVKFYPFVLSRNDHITNFIADAPNAVEMISRYNRNDILDADEDIDYNKVALKNPDCRVWLYDIARMTKAKDDSVDVYRFQQIWQNGAPYYQIVGTNAKMKIQGTSSVNYRYGAANTDIDFGKKKAPNATLVDGNNNNLLADGLEYPGFKINDNSLPITYSNTKVNFASCEQVNNMCNAEWYQRYQPFPSLSARDCMEFAMGVQFIKDRHENEPADGISLFDEKGADFNPEKYYMYSIANMGTSKKNTHIFHSEDELCIEIKENTTDAQKMKSFDADWVLPDHAGNYEIRYPDIKPDAFTQEMKDGWERFVTWMVASNPGAATNAALAEPVTFEPYTFRGHNRTVTETEGRHFEQVLRGVTVSQYAGTYTNDTFEYRMAKMLSECEDYMAMDSVIYHFCFIERHTMVDNVAKNTFWSSIKEIGGANDEEGYWIWDLSKNYDNDTADGNNNNGLLVFDYGNEAADTRDGTPVFNGHDAVWFVFASNLYEACRAMFVNREAIGAWDSRAYHNYLLGEQRKVPERIWNECYWYDYLRTYENDIETTWINFLDGGQKTHQRKHYETYEEIYDSSKYRGSFSHNQSITLRGEAIDYQTLGLPAQESKFTITMFNKCYLTIWIGTNYQTVKCEKGVPVTLHFYKDNDESKGYMSLANSVIDIDSGSMVQAIGDLSRIYPSSGQFGAAKRLRSLQIGSDTAGYYNPNMNTNSILTFNNKMLEQLYVQNLPQATYNLDLSGCPELKYLKASGSGFTGFVFANGGLLNEAYINAPSSLVMRNLNNLTNANFHLTDPTAVTSLRLENCTLFDNLTFVNQLTNLNVIRLTNIDWTLDTNTLLDRLLGLMGINEAGITVAQSYLAGNVQLTGVVYGGDYNSYLNAWSPDLTVDVSHASQFIAQHLVTYKDEDGTTLATKYVNHGSSFVDIVDTSELTMPTKDPDIESRYVFGRLEFGEYVPYSGWGLTAGGESFYPAGAASANVPAINGDLTVYAIYTATAQQYVVRWLVGNKIIATTDLQNYGGGYNLSAPTIKDVQNASASTCTFTDNGDGTCSYSIMTGWEKLPTNIRPTSATGPYDIQATWLERTNVNYNTVLTSNDYSVEEKLFVLKNVSSLRSNLEIQDVFPITLGYDGLEPGVTLLGTPKRYTGTADAAISAYTPFAANKSFTIAIDYRFEQVANDNVNEAVLLSCYEEANGSTQGFKLFYNPKAISPVPQISFGDTSQLSDSNVYTIGSNLNNRGIVVLRHLASEPEYLYVYSGSNASGLINEYSPSNFRKVLIGSGNASNAKIILGGVNSSSSTMNARGTLYSVKYWEEDLGEGECMQLANWCHETMSFAVQDFTEADVHSALDNQSTSNIVLHTLNASAMGTITDASINRNTENSVGWDPSVIRTFYNGRIHQALPILLQSIMVPANIKHVKGYKRDGGYPLGNNNTTTQDYVFAPSYREIGGETNTNVSYDTNYNGEAAGPFTWSGLKIMKYVNGQFVQQTGMPTAYINLRFPYRALAINNNTKVFVDYPTVNSSFETYAASNSLGLNTGDILIPSGSDASVAYIYVNNNDIRSGAPFVLNGDAYLTTTNGAWIESTSWWTRSVGINNVTGTNNSRFTSINKIGNPQAGNYKTNGLVYSIAL